VSRLNSFFVFSWSPVLLLYCSPVLSRLALALFPDVVSTVGMFRLLTIARHTLFETIVQPIFALLLAMGCAILVVFALLPYFTLGEDTRMFKSVGFDVILLLSLIMTLLAASRCIYEEIEDRTMLTLLSKPVSRAQVLVGKYLGLVLACACAIVVMGCVLALCVRERVPSDYLISTRSIFDDELNRLSAYRWMHLAGVGPGLVLIWLQVSVLTAVSVAVSTRLPLVVNFPLVILVYLAGNLTRFVGGAVEDRGVVTQGLGWVMQTVLPFLAVFDLRDLTVFANIKLSFGPTANDPTAVGISTVWLATLWAGLYSVLYATAALCAGLLLLRSRDLGGGE
jgi:ABC-type Na+ efflux pump permease subunit